MPAPLTILLRSLLAFGYLLLLSRLMGRQLISQLNFFDFIVGITIGSIAAAMSSDPRVGIVGGLVALTVWGALPIILGKLALRSISFRKIVAGEPTVVIRDGKILEENLAVLRYSTEDLLMQLRTKDIFDLSEVEFAAIEPNGKLSVLKKSAKQPLTPSQAGLDVTAKGMPAVVIMDGQILRSTLKSIGRDEAWLLDELYKRGIKDAGEVFVAQVDTSGNLYVDLEDDEGRVQPPKAPAEAKLVADLRKMIAILESFALETDNPDAEAFYREGAEKLADIRKRVSPYLS